MYHNSDMGTNIFGFMVNSDKDVFRWQEIEMHHKIKSDEPWIQCTAKADTPNANLHNIQCSPWQTEPDLAAAPASILEIQVAAVAAMIKTPVADPMAAAAAAAIIKTLAPVALGLTPIEMSDSSTKPGVIMAVMRVWKASWWVIGITMTMTMTMTLNRDPHLKDPTYWMVVVVLPVWITMEG